MDRAAREALLREARVIAVVGLSNRPGRPSLMVAQYLRDVGYVVWGVNPDLTSNEVDGIKVVQTLEHIDGPIDIVDVFRRPETTPEVAREAVAAGAKAVWLQLGIRSDEARGIAEAAGVFYVEDRCLKVDHAALQSLQG